LGRQSHGLLKAIACWFVCRALPVHSGGRDARLAAAETAASSRLQLLAPERQPRGEPEDDNQPDVDDERPERVARFRAQGVRAGRPEEAAGREAADGRQGADDPADDEERETRSRRRPRPTG